MAIDDIVSFPGVTRTTGTHGARNATYQCTAKTAADAVYTLAMHSEEKPKAVIQGAFGRRYELFPGSPIENPTASTEEKLLKGFQRGANEFSDLFVAPNEQEKAYRDAGLTDRSEGLAYSARRLLGAWMEGRVNLTETDRYSVPTRHPYMP